MEKIPAPPESVMSPPRTDSSPVMRGALNGRENVCNTVPWNSIGPPRNPNFGSSATARNEGEAPSPDKVSCIPLAKAPVASALR